MECKFPKSWIPHAMLLYDTKKEEGRVRTFAALPKDVVGLDILQDWIVELQDEYTKLHKEVFK
jgi:hypothetical protein